MEGPLYESCTEPLSPASRYCAVLFFCDCLRFTSTECLKALTHVNKLMKKSTCFQHRHKNIKNIVQHATQSHLVFFLWEKKMTEVPFQFLEHQNGPDA